MALDPVAAAALGASADPGAVLSQRVRDLEREVAALKRTPTIQLTAGAPGGGPTPREGTPALQSGAPPKLWLYIGGGWHFVSLT